MATLTERLERIHNNAADGFFSELILASMYGDLQAVKHLLANGADVNAQAKNGMTALVIACEYGYTEVVRALLVAGADVNHAGTGDYEGATALSCAIFGDDDGNREISQGELRELVSLLRDHGATVPIFCSNACDIIMKY